MSVEEIGWWAELLLEGAEPTTLVELIDLSFFFFLSHEVKKRP